MADYISQITLPNNDTYSLKDNEAVRGNARIYYGTCTTEAETALKEIICTTYDKNLTIGDMIIVKFANTNSAAVADLQLTIKNTITDITGTTAINIKRQYNSTGANNLLAVGELNSDSIAVFIYNGTYWILTNADYNNTYNYAYVTGAGGADRIAETQANGGVGIHRYSLQMMTENLTWSSLASNYPTTATTNGANVSKTVATCAFLISSPILYQDTNANAAPGGNVNVNGYTSAPLDLRYSTISTSTSWTSLIIQKPVFLVGTLENDGISFKLNSTQWWTQTLPTSATNGTIYIYLGLAYTTTSIYLTQVHPIYWHDGNKLQLYNSYAAKASDAITVNGHTINHDVPSNAVFTDTWNALSTSSAGYVSQAPNDRTQFLRGDATWAVLPTATNTILGGVKPWYYHSVDSTGPTTGVDASSITINEISVNTGKYYAIESDLSGRLFVNVPWENTHDVTKLIVGGSNSTSNTNVNSGNVYLRLFDGNTHRNNIQLEAGNNIAITNTRESDTDTIIKIDASLGNITFPVTSVNEQTGAVTITAADLGLSNALHFIGQATTNPTANSATVPTISGKPNYSSPEAGDIILGYDNGREYVWDGNVWILLGQEASTTLNSDNITPSTSSNNTWISNITQNSDRTISVSRTTLDTSGAWQGTATSWTSSQKTKVILDTQYGTNTSIGQVETEINGGQSVVQQIAVDGILNIANGGTNTSSSPTVGGLIYGALNASNKVYYASTGIGSSGQVIISNGSSTPDWYNGLILSSSTSNNNTTYEINVNGKIGFYENNDYTYTYGDEYTPIYWNEGKPTKVSVTQQYPFTLTPPTSNNENTTGEVTANITLSNTFKANTIVLQIVVDDGYEYLLSPIEWEIEDTNNNIQLSATMDLTDGSAVSGYILTAIGPDQQSSNT